MFTDKFKVENLREKNNVPYNTFPYFLYINLHLNQFLEEKKYLSIIRNFEQRRSLTKLTNSSHHLRIESGRYQDTLLNDRTFTRLTPEKWRMDIIFYSNVLNLMMTAIIYFKR